MSEFEKTVIKTLKEKGTTKSNPNSFDDVESIIDTSKMFQVNKIKAIKIKKVGREDRRYGLLDSGATHNVREVKTR